jgi:hypothetical protein
LLPFSEAVRVPCCAGIIHPISVFRGLFLLSFQAEPLGVAEFQTRWFEREELRQGVSLNPVLLVV